jgi:hypothetical protein
VTAILLQTLLCSPSQRKLPIRWMQVNTGFYDGVHFHRVIKDFMLQVRDAKSSLGDAKSSLGDATSSLGDAKRSLGDAKSSLGDVHRVNWQTRELPRWPRRRRLRRRRCV